MSSTSSASLVTVQVEDLLRFFDEKPDWSLKRATSLVGIAGEDLNAASFQHYVESKGWARLSGPGGCAGGRCGP